MEVFSHPYTFFHLLVMVFVLLVSVPFSMTPYLPYIGGRYRWAGRNLNGISQHTISYGSSNDLILDHTVQLKPMIKALSSGRMVSSDVVIASVHFEKTHLKKLMMMRIMMMMMMIIMRINYKK